MRVKGEDHHSKKGESLIFILFKSHITNLSEGKSYAIESWIIR
jgi:hypothetical protein